MDAASTGGMGEAVDDPRAQVNARPSRYVEVEDADAPAPPPSRPAGGFASSTRIHTAV